MLTQTDGVQLRWLDGKSQRSQHVSCVHAGDKNSSNICKIILSLSSVTQSDKEAHKKQG